MRLRLAAIGLTLSLSSFSFAGTAQIVPTTTLAAETGNNTSAANGFAGFSNGDAPAGNVSKLPISSLLYPGSNTKIYVHFQPWFGGTNHVNVGYNSADPAQVQRQVQDMLSRGVSGAIVDWYGQNFSRENQTTLYLMAEAEAQHGNFNFAVTEDQGAIQSCAQTPGCDFTGQLISDLNYAATTYENSPAYLRINNQPAVFFFGEEAYAIDWNRVRANVTGNPLFIFQNSGGFFYAQSNGGYAWVEPSATSASDPLALGYLVDFYTKGLSVPVEQTFGAAYKGFNDSIASWSGNRVMTQSCGQTWLQTMAEAGKFYSAGNQLAQLQVVTWNDYEEGTEMESGIDPCVSLSASVANGVANWTVSGSEAPIDHYTVYISSDGQNLMSLGDVPTGSFSMNLTKFGFAPGSYTVLVQAVGKPNIQNRMSNAAAYSVQRQNPNIIFSVTPGSGLAPVAVSASIAGSTDPDGSIASTSIDFGDGTVTSAAAASHTYTVPGVYTVRAIVTGNDGGSAAATAQVTVTAPQAPVAKLAVSATNGMAPVNISASTAGSYAPSGTIAATTIDFGDGTVVNGASATHNYVSPGAYTIRATVTSSYGGSAVASAQVTVSAPPPISGCAVPSSPGVNVCAPSAGATVSSAVSVVASGANASGSVNHLELWIDGSKIGDYPGASMNTSVSLSNGVHAATVIEVDSKGAYIKSPPVTFTVAPSGGGVATGTCTAPVSPGVNVCAPSAGATVSSAVSVVASGANASGSVNHLELWIDGSKMGDYPGASMNTSVSLSNGVHAATVIEVDSKGAYIKSPPVTFTVAPSGGGVATGTCTAPVSPGVNFCAPVSGKSYASTAQFIAAGKGASGSVDHLELWIDNNKVGDYPGASMNATVALGKGSHTATMVEVDSKGGYLKSTPVVFIVN